MMKEYWNRHREIWSDECGTVELIVKSKLLNLISTPVGYRNIGINANGIRNVLQTPINIVLAYMEMERCEQASNYWVTFDYTAKRIDGTPNGSGGSCIGAHEHVNPL
jgi:hypothetical protein